MTPQKLPYDKFLDSFKVAPRIAVDLWVKSENGDVLYTKRHDTPFEGYWHIPGTFLLVGESIEQCVKRVAQEELKLHIEVKNPKLLWLDEDLHEPRGHVVHLVYSIKVKKEVIKESRDKKFFFEPPQHLIPSHRHIFLNIS